MDGCLLFNLPEEVLKYIGSFLGPRDLLAASVTCHTLRTVFNDNLIWRRFTDGGEISRRLDNVPSIVQPQYSALLQLGALSPLCQQRQHFRKQSRLLHNLRHGKCVKHSISFDGYLFEFETHSTLKKREVIYADEYLFTLAYKDDRISEIIHIFNIKSMPYLFKTLELEKHVEGYSVIICVQVIKTKLIVRQDQWFDVYQINLPREDIPLLQSFCINDLSQSDHELVFGHLLFYSCESLNVVRVWNHDTLEQCCDIHPKINGSDFRVLACSDNFIEVLLCATMLLDESDRLAVYNMQTQIYTGFDVEFHSGRNEFRGLIDGSFVVIVSESSNVKCSIHLFHIESSVEIDTKSNVDIFTLNFVAVKNGFIYIPSHFSLLILNLTNLQPVYELQFDTNSLIPEIPQHHLHTLEFINISKLHLLLIINKYKDAEIWNLENMRKLDVVHGVSVGDSTSSVSKLIIRGDGRLCVISYW